MSIAQLQVKKSHHKAPQSIQIIEIGRSNFSSIFLSGGTDVLVLSAVPDACTVVYREQAS